MQLPRLLCLYYLLDPFVRHSIIRPFLPHLFIKRPEPKLSSSLKMDTPTVGIQMNAGAETGSGNPLATAQIECANYNDRCGFIHGTDYCDGNQTERRNVTKQSINYLDMSTEQRRDSDMHASAASGTTSTTISSFGSQDSTSSSASPQWDQRMSQDSSSASSAISFAQHIFSSCSDVEMEDCSEHTVGVSRTGTGNQTVDNQSPKNRDGTLYCNQTGIMSGCRPIRRKRRDFHVNEHEIVCQNREEVTGRTQESSEINSVDHVDDDYRRTASVLITASTTDTIPEETDDSIYGTDSIQTPRCSMPTKLPSTSLVEDTHTGNMIGGTAEHSTRFPSPILSCTASPALSFESLDGMERNQQRSGKANRVNSPTFEGRGSGDRHHGLLQGRSNSQELDSQTLSHNATSGWRVSVSNSSPLSRNLSCSTTFLDNTNSDEANGYFRHSDHQSLSPESGLSYSSHHFNTFHDPNAAEPIGAPHTEINQRDYNTPFISELDSWIAPSTNESGIHEALLSPYSPQKLSLRPTGSQSGHVTAVAPIASKCASISPRRNAQLGRQSSVASSGGVPSCNSAATISTSGTIPFSTPPSYSPVYSNSILPQMQPNSSTEALTPKPSTLKRHDEDVMSTAASSSKSVLKVKSRISDGDCHCAVDAIGGQRECEMYDEDVVPLVLRRMVCVWSNVRFLMGNLSRHDCRTAWAYIVCKLTGNEELANNVHRSFCVEVNNVVLNQYLHMYIYIVCVTTYTHSLCTYILANAKAAQPLQCLCDSSF